jgi:para-nitrobenzyl esterase
LDGVVAVGQGLLRGAREGALWVFRGVPYASTSTGAGRWRKPRPPAAWTGVRDALAWGPIAPQSPPVPGLRIPGDPDTWDEDCLNLNIWTPGLDDGRRPVLVWLHAGGFTSGSGSSTIYRGDRLAARGDAVVVTLNYRLGALGFLAHPRLREEDGSGCGNWGLYDQLAALEWVHSHIGTFGGDPENVTLFGESAGAMSVSALLTTPACGRLFHRAVLQSGPPVTAGTSLAQRRSERLCELAGLAPGSRFDRRSLERLEPQELVRATQALALQLPAEEGLPLPLLPVVDGGLLARPPAQAIADGAAAKVPLLIGTTRDEASLYMATDPSTQDLDEQSVIRRVRNVATEESARSLVAAYRDAREARGEPATPREVLTAITTDYVFRLPSLALATVSYKHQPSTFAYLFTWESPFLGGIFGSSHGLDIPFVFGTVEEEVVGPFSGSGPQAFDLSEAMQQAWLAFARTGDPSCDAVGEWPAYDPLRRPTMLLGPRRAVESDPRGQERSAWDEAGIEITGGHHHELLDL